MPIALLLLSCAGGGTDTAGTDGIRCPSPSTWYVDGDGDGFGAGEATGQGCERPDGQVANADDCDDSDEAVNPFATETCNGIDDDCDGLVDPSGSDGEITCYEDNDGDGFGNPDAGVLACDCADGTVRDNTDCDDQHDIAWPGNDEILYDGIDGDCGGMEGEYDADGDGFDWVGGEGVDGRDCNDDDPAINPAAWEDCSDDVDDDCDGVIDECGLSPQMTADDAWVTVYRDPVEDNEPLRDVATFGDGLVAAGDADLDGNREILGPVVTREYGETADDFSYKLVEIPARSSNADLEIGDVTMASFQLPKDGRNWGFSAAWIDDSAIADRDLDGDGIADYLFVASWDAVGEPEEGESAYSSRLDFWSGPADGLVELGDEGTVGQPVSPSGVRYNNTLEYLEGSGTDGSWQVAVPLWPSNEAAGGEHPGILFIEAQHLSGDAPVESAVTLTTSSPREPIPRLEAVDFDGDGIDDLVNSSQPYRSNLPTGRVWVFQGPFDADRSFDDAELTIDGAGDDDDFGAAFAVTSDLDGDGRPDLVVQNPEYRGTPSTAYFFSPTAHAWPGAIGLDDAVATIVSTDDCELSINYPPEMVGDIDADGVDELALTLQRFEGEGGLAVLVLEPPSSGVTELGSSATRITGDPDIDNWAGFGSSMLSGVDYDGDGYDDLVIGEYFWDADPVEAYTPYGRFLIYRGEVGGE